MCLQGLECAEVQLRNATEKLDTDSKKPLTADPSRPIPLQYESLLKSNTLLPSAVRRPQLSTWQLELTSLLMVRAAVAYRLLAECSLSLGHYGRSLRFARIGIRCLGRQMAPVE